MTNEFFFQFFPYREHLFFLPSQFRRITAMRVNQRKFDTQSIQISAGKSLYFHYINKNYFSIYKNIKWLHLKIGKAIKH